MRVPEKGMAGEVKHMIDAQQTLHADELRIRHDLFDKRLAIDFLRPQKPMTRRAQCSKESRGVVIKVMPQVAS